jgi:eukaryotic-like serine/threonine-protein kinase
MSSLHQRAKDLFLEALDRPKGDRAAFLAKACDGEPDLLREVESLLAFHEESGPAESEPEAASFAPGEMFAGRYRMVTRIGRGGMGDVWRADDMVLNTPVALKLIAAKGPVGRDRFLNEVRLARQITHPAVCRVFDVGESGEWIFYSMEFVSGEDLASLIRRVGRLPSDRVTDIARQLCGGLAAAHAQGVLHRDLKPANILVDDSGLVRITDFGIAILRTDAELHMLTGTPGYMAPEQRTTGTTLSERTDVYALGLVLYELLVGAHPLRSRDKTQTPPPPSSIVPTVNPQLERAIMKSLASRPEDRPANALAVAAELPNIGVRRMPGMAPTVRLPKRPRSWWLAGVGTAAAVALLAALASFFVKSGTGTLTERDTVVLADFENTTGEPVFDGALGIALAVSLEQSPFIKVFPEDRARETLRLMERPGDQPITRAIAREIARREQLKALIAGSIASLGSHYVIALEAINAETGDAMARDQAEATSKERVLTALGDATTRLREKLGESLASVQRFDAALPRATTPSLDALHAYSLALTEGREVPRLESIPHLKHAIELDPTFAMAHAQLSSVYANTGQSLLAPQYSEKAFELRDRVSERERFFISWRYFRDAIQDNDKALELARLWTATYPREAFAFNALGSALIRYGQFEQAAEPLRQAIRLDGRFAPAYSNLAAVLMALGRYDESRTVLTDAAARKLDFIGARRLSYLLAFVQGDTVTMGKELDSSVGVSETNSAFGWQAHASAFAGRVNDAHEQFHRGVQLAMQGNFPEVAAQLRMEDAESHAGVGQCAEARREVAAGLEASRDNLTLERASRALAVCGIADSTSLTTELTKRFPTATLTTRVSVPIAAAALALSKGDAQGALERLEPLRQYDHAPLAEFWPVYLRGQAYLRLKNTKGATDAFQEIVSRRGEVPVSMFFPLSYLGLARSAALARDIDGAKHAYQQFFAIWKDADSELPPLIEARAEYAKLR